MKKTNSAHPTNEDDNRDKTDTQVVIETAVDFFYNRIKNDIKNNDDLIQTVYVIAKQKERNQHRNTWDAAIKTHEDRGYVYARSFTDFEDYIIK